MSQKPTHPSLRFVHSSDLHLERPLGGVAEVPARLRELFLESPYLAAERVFETVLSEKADALLLAGDVVDVEQAGPRAVLFLIDQFQRLADHNIPVYWACGLADQLTDWPAHAKLPQNVTCFPAGQVKTILCQRDEETIARIQGISRSPGAALDDSQFHRDAHGLFTVGISYETSASAGTEGDRLHYMALGGQHRRQTVDQSPGLAHYCGTPQGRTPDESGPHGCTVVQVDETGHIKTRLVPTDVVRWLTETIEITASTDESGLLNQLLKRNDCLREKHAGPELLITWRIVGNGPLLTQMHPGGLAARLLKTLRERQQDNEKSVWSVAIICDAALDVPAEWYDQETILGDLLRQIQRMENEDDISLQLNDFLPDELRDHYSETTKHEDVKSGNGTQTKRSIENPLSQLVEIENPLQRKILLREAAKLGIDLITIEDRP
jgi:exonuclease SbcD